MKRESALQRRLFCNRFISGVVAFVFLPLICMGIIVSNLLVERGVAQGGGYERSFAESKATVEGVLREMPFALAGRLPVLDGFALPGDRPLDSYQRGYFQSTVQVTATASGGSVVHVTTKVTAWYADPIPARSGYRLLTSNGRVEGDLLDELAAELGKRAAGRVSHRETAANEAPVSAAISSSPSASAVAPATGPVAGPEVARPQVSQAQPADTAPAAPMPRLPETGGTFSSGLAHGLAEQQTGNTPTPPPGPRVDAGLKAEVESLEEILKNQSHPKNLVAVKKSGTPVVDSPSLKGKTLFLASEHDEFEMLDYNADWVHVKISGLSRGWVWRNSLEMPGDIPDLATKPAELTAADLFHVTREETSIFPGDWRPLRGKSVKIFSVEMIDEKTKNSTSQVKLEFAKSLLEQSYADIAKNSATLGGVVLIFDSADGGMLAVTLPVLQQWKAGTLSDAALWHQSFFDPPETFGSSAGTSASQ